VRRRSKLELGDGDCGVIVTIDGPAGAGKSSVAKQVAAAIGFDFLDTGAMYRAITLAAIRADVDWQDSGALIDLARKTEIEFREDRIFLFGEDVSGLVRLPSVTDVIRHVADIPEIRDILTHKQREYAFGRDVVTEGRDQGSEVFPAAECKIFLTASPEERALRRQQQLAAAGRHVPVEDILVKQNQRDLEDRMRPVGRLRPADDAVLVQTDGLSPQQVLERVLTIIHARRDALVTELG
jgi:cytidylate kinase